VIRVAVNGYGTIGKRVADAVRLQPDMALVGVAKTRPNFEALGAVRSGIPIYVPEGSEEAFERAGIRVAGTVKEMLSRADVIVDATPDGVGEKNRPMYESAGVKAIFQGGEEPEVAEVPLPHGPLQLEVRPSLGHADQGHVWLEPHGIGYPLADRAVAVDGDPYHLALTPLARASTAGSGSPDRKTSMAPPPVETWTLLPGSSPARPAMLAMWPPPIITNPFPSTADLSTETLPSLNLGSSMTPMGPLRTTSLASLIREE